MPSTTTPRPRILVIENESVSAKISEALSSPDGAVFTVECVYNLADAMERLGTTKIDAILLVLDLPDSKGIETFDKVHALARGAPILILDDSIAGSLTKEAVMRGAADYVLPKHIDNYTLPRALRNVIERREVEDALFVEKERAVVTLNSIGDAVLTTDVEGQITYLNLVAESLTGWNRIEAVGKPLEEVFHIVDGSTREPVRDPMALAVQENRAVGLPINCILIRRDGHEFAIEDSVAPIHDRAGQVIGAVIVFHDVTAAREMALRMTHAAQYDAVTDLANRTLLNDRITQSICMARRQKKSLAIIFLDLDHFKNINDSLGHSAGDLLLQSVAKRLVANVRGSDTVSRQGGDEFVILLSEVAHPEDAGTSASKILISLSSPHPIAGHELHIDGSIGISIFPGDGEDAEALIKNADTAMYHAKEVGRNNFQFFKSAMNLAAVLRQSVEAKLRGAVEREDFVLHYQPKINLHSGQITGMEALVRWREEGGELIYPGQFIAVAEDSGLIAPIGRWVMREACGQARRWQDAGLPALPVAVNVSAIEFRNPEFVAGVRRILSDTGLDGRFLELELTEGVLMRDVETTVEVLQELKSIGIRFALDDFGTGYSSLSYLRKLPIDVFKIDQSFVRDLVGSSSDAAMVGAIIAMGNGLNHVVVAEGIETQEQKAYLEFHSCAEGQGYYFSHPLPAVQFANLLQEGMPEATVLVH